MGKPMKAPAWTGSPRELVFVGDDHEDAFLLEEALSEVGNAIAVHCPTIDAFKTYLNRRMTDNSLTTIGAILVDLRLPGAHGLKLLRDLKQNWQTQKLPVILLGAMDHPATDACCNQGADCVCTKPSDLAGFEQLVQGVQNLQAAT